MAVAKTQYDFFLANADRLQAEVEQAQKDGRSLQQILDEKHSSDVLLGSHSGQAQPDRHRLYWPNNRRMRRHL